MRFRTVALVLVLVVIVAIIFSDVWRSPETKIARRLSALAASPEQARLWKQVADRGAGTGLGNLQRTTRPVEQSQPSTAPDAPIPPQGTGRLPTGLVSGVRVVTTAGLGTTPIYQMGSVDDVDATGERLTLRIGTTQTMTLQARAGGQPLKLMKGDSVQVEYRASSSGRRGRNQILAVRGPGPNGGGIARITVAGPKPVTADVQTFDLHARQELGSPGVRAGSVTVVVGDNRRNLNPGDVVQVGNTMVALLASRIPSGPASSTVEGSPFAIELVAWR